MAERIPSFQPGSPATVDGTVLLYTPHEAQSSPYFSSDKRVIFINGIWNKGEGHAAGALALARLQMCPVIGVYNAMSGWVLDLVQCITDKYQFSGPLADSPAEALGRAAEKAGPSASKEDLMAAALEGNLATQGMFRLLCRPEHVRTEIFAHSQGNIILCNALHALVAAGRTDAVRGRIVNTFGSPVVPSNWPQEVRLREFGFTWDLVTWAGGPDWKLNISKVGMPAGASMFKDGFGAWLYSRIPVSHLFIEYMKMDPTFVVNRFRWGSLGLTVSMDEKGLGEALVEMGRNFARVNRVLEHLKINHNSDSDDVALEYVNALRDPRRSSRDLGAAVKRDAPLRKQLISLMDSGWTGGDEKKAIAWLKSP